MKLILVVVCAVSFIINLPGILVWSEYGLFYAWTKERLGNNAMEIVIWDPKYSPIVQHYQILNEDYISNIPVAAAAIILAIFILKINGREIYVYS